MDNSFHPMSDPCQTQHEPSFLVASMTSNSHLLILCRRRICFHYSDVIISMVACQMIGVSVVCLTVCSRGRSKKTSKHCVTGLCEGNSPVTGEIPSPRKMFPFGDVIMSAWNSKIGFTQWPRYCCLFSHVYLINVISTGINLSVHWAGFVYK